MKKYYSNSPIKKKKSSLSFAYSRPKRRFRPSPVFLLAITIVVATIITLLFLRLTGRTPDPVLPSVSKTLSSSFQSNNAIASSKAPSVDYDNLTPAVEGDISDLEVETFNTMMIVGERGFRYFNFNKDSTIRYIDAIQKLSKDLPSATELYLMVLPTATDIILPQDFLKDKKTSDQQKAIEYINTSMAHVSPNIKAVETFDILKANCNREIFFSTDRNWTSLGAYYGYRAFSKVRGLSATPLDNLETVEYSGFIGSLYEQSNADERLNYGEPIIIYTPPDPVDVTIISHTEESEGTLFMDVSEEEGDKKYKAFLGGSYPLISLENKKIDNDTSILVIKDGMGNPFIPYLSQHYKKIFALDYRFYQGKIRDLITKHSISEILIMNHIEATSDAIDVNYFENLS